MLNLCHRYDACDICNVVYLFPWRTTKVYLMQYVHVSEHRNFSVRLREHMLE